jgi:non-specific serine/threonine protein kinase
VPSLSTPSAAQITRESSQGYEAVQLFIERARAANPRFELTDQNVSSVAQICARLDGIPLALELAAARVSIFPPEQIATRLDDRFKLLTGGSRTALPRQQTLRALIDWSYDLLSEDERALLRRLSVFAGGWTFEAAEAISPDLDILNLLIQLVNKSLVIVDDKSEQPRYHLLETIRQYARDKLLEAGEAEQARNAHLNYFVAFSEMAGPRIDTESVMEWIFKLDADYDNLRTAFEWGLDRDIPASLRMVGSLANYWFRHGHGAEGIQMATAALGRADTLVGANKQKLDHKQMMIHARAFQAMAFLCYSQGDNPNAYQAADKCISFARQLNDLRMLATSLAFAGSARLFEGDYTTGRKQIEEAMTITIQAGDKFARGMALGMMAQVEMIANHNIQAAVAYEQQALALTREIAGTWTSLMLYFGIGRGAMFRGDYALARERFAYCLPLFEQMKDEHRVNMIHSELAHMDRYEEKLPQAEERYRKTILVWQKLGHRAAVAHQLECFAFLAKVHEEPERALRLLGAAEILREKINIHMQPQERNEYGREVNELHASMTELEFAASWAQGRAMTMDEAIEFAVGSSKV